MAYKENEKKDQKDRTQITELRLSEKLLHSQSLNQNIYKCWVLSKRVEKDV